MKRYWPLLLIAILLAAVIGVSQYAESTKEQCEKSAADMKAALVAKGNYSEADNDAKDACKPPIWAGYFAWPEGVGAWAVILTLFVIAWQSIATAQAAEATEASAVGVDKQLRIMKRQTRIQAAAMQQWIEIEPLRAVTPKIPTDPLEITLQFELLNKTAYLFTVKKIVTTTANGIGPAKTFTVEPDTPVPLNSGHRFYAKAPVERTVWNRAGTIFTVTVEVTYLNCLRKLQTQYFENLYRGLPSGQLALMKPSGIVPTVADYDAKHNPNEEPASQNDS